ncbi:hypothetical protein CYY_005610 [Polysphondylium violaceum]|uniref:Thioredoxin domain-containing protein n=1 Tax=Polysphondylium violaceum TaxID=133409 RepID=A0A8J4PTJ1_9MYCE|nr:hypothetical protein CYY_005610 [Polysphondylium violaceum]
MLKVINSSFAISSRVCLSSAASTVNKGARLYSTSKVTTQDFEELVLKSKSPVVLDVYADWCPPCRALEPVLKKAVEGRNGNVKLYKLNFDDSPEIAERYNVMSIPHVFAFSNGEVVDQFVGALQAPAINKFLDKLESTHK